MGNGLALSQLITDVVADVGFVSVPLYLWKNDTLKTLIFTHVKAAISLIICNLLVIVTFIYRNNSGVVEVLRISHVIFILHSTIR